MGFTGYLKTMGRLPALAPLRAVWAYRHGWMREAWRIRREQPDNLFQPNSFTAMNRYPRCFAFVFDALGELPALNLLSFGCATGEEVFTLARYFPRAHIKGIDINARSIATATRNTPPALAHRISFEVACSAHAEPAGSYHAVFAFAVFRDDALTGKPPKCDHVLRFADFDREISNLARCLRPGGLLFLRHSHFRFSDATVAGNFETALALDIDISAGTKALYDADNRLVRNDAATADVAWRKR